MKPLDIKDLVTGLMVVIVLFISIGQFDALRKFAIKEMARTVTMKSNFKAFRFPNNYEVRNQ